jgi:hypothetical protein
VWLAARKAGFLKNLTRGRIDGDDSYCGLRCAEDDQQKAIGTWLDSGN